jgi:hypothetical protein
VSNKQLISNILFQITWHMNCDWLIFDVLY